MKKLVFEDFPSTKTPIDATNLNQLQTNIENEFTKTNEDIEEINEKHTYIENEFIKINEDIEEINEKHTYSTTEQIIGAWIDGKPLYRKTFILENIGTEQDLGIQNIDSVFIDAGNSYITWNWDEFSYPIDRAKFQIYKLSPSIKSADEAVADWKAVITLKYTKTTD